MIKICYTHLDAELSADALANYLQRLPFALQSKIQRYRKKWDVQRVLLGKLLLQNGLNDLIGPGEYLNALQYSQTGKPFIPNTLEFNLAYAGKYVLCVFNTKGAIGIDIEKIRPVDLNDYSFVFQGEVFRTIRQSIDPAAAFFENWTLREAVLKAEGCGLTEEAKSIRVENGYAWFKNKQWYYKSLLLDPGYLGYLATDVPFGELLIEKTSF